LSVRETINSATVEQLVEWWNLDDPPEWASETSLFLNFVAGALRRAGEDGVRVLKTEAALDSDTKKRYLAINSLAARKIADRDVVGYILAAFHKDHPGWKARALDWLVSISCFPLERSEVESLQQGGELEADAMRYLSNAYPDEAVTILSNGLRSTDKWVRGTACTEAGFRNIRELREQVAGLQNDKDDYVARSAQIGVEMFDIAGRSPNVDSPAANKMEGHTK